MIFCFASLIPLTQTERGQEKGGEAYRGAKNVLKVANEGDLELHDTQHHTRKDMCMKNSRYWLGGLALMAVLILVHFQETFWE